MNNTTTQVPLCKDCQHLLPYQSAAYDDNRLRLAECARSVVIVNLIDGSERHRFCETERGENGECGPAGKHFVADNSDVTP